MHLIQSAGIFRITSLSSQNLCLLRVYKPHVLLLDYCCQLYPLALKNFEFVQSVQKNVQKVPLWPKFILFELF